jgi:hypothetical protein
MCRENPRRRQTQLPTIMRLLMNRLWGLFVILFAASCLAASPICEPILGHNLNPGHCFIAIEQLTYNVHVDLINHGSSKTHLHTFSRERHHGFSYGPPRLPIIVRHESCRVAIDLRDTVTGVQTSHVQTTWANIIDGLNYIYEECVRKRCPAIGGLMIKDNLILIIMPTLESVVGISPNLPLRKRALYSDTP